MNKNTRLGSDPLSWIKDTREKKPAKQQASKSARQKASKAVRQYTRNKIKATYYLNPKLIKSLKIIGVERDRDLSNLVSEAIKDLIEKYSQ